MLPVIDEFYILSNFEFTRLKVNVTEVMAAAGGIVLRVHILLSLKRTPFRVLFSNLVCMIPMMSGTSYQRSKSLGKGQGHRGHGCRGGILLREHILFSYHIINKFL